MMVTIAVPALYDGYNTFLDSSEVGISAYSTVVGIESKPTFPTIPGFAGTFTNTLRVADPDKGTFFLNLTLAAYDAIVSAALQNINKEITSRYVIGASPVSIITDTNLFNVTINAILVDNGPIDISTITYTPLTNSTITFATPLPATSVVQIIYNKN